METRLVTALRWSHAASWPVSPLPPNVRVTVLSVVEGPINFFSRVRLVNCSDYEQSPDIPVRRRLMVADDDESVRELVGCVARAAGFDVVLAANGDDAAKQLERGSFDVLVTDIYMPGKDGLELIRQARVRHPNMQIIAISGGGISGYNPLRVASQMGAAQVIAKPFDVSQLMDSLKRTDGGSSSL
jgi:CheY-like chemotaxis protein